MANKIRVHETFVYDDVVKQLNDLGYGKDDKNIRKSVSKLIKKAMKANKDIYTVGSCFLVTEDCLIIVGYKKQLKKLVKQLSQNVNNKD